MLVLSLILLLTEVLTFLVVPGYTGAVLGWMLAIGNCFIPLIATCSSQRSNSERSSVPVL